MKQSLLNLYLINYILFALYHKILQSKLVNSYVLTPYKQMFCFHNDFLISNKNNIAINIKQYIA